MRKIVLICLIIIPFWGFSQNTQIKNIELDVKNTDVIINYNLIGKQNVGNETDLVLIDNFKNIYIPEDITGNIRTNLNEGKNTLRFDMKDQDFPLDRKLTPLIILDHNVKKGPNASLLSFLVPGLGDYLVESPKNMLIKPYYRTAAVGGLLALALISNSKIEDVEYFDEEVWIPGHTGYAGKIYPGYYETQTFKTNPKDYWLFRNDKEIFLGAAISIWVFDIFWVMNKGQQNQKIKKTLKNKNYDFSLSSNGFSCKINLK